MGGYDWPAYGAEIKTEMAKLTYLIDDFTLTIDTDSDDKFQTGKDICLSEKFSDITRALEWYDAGYSLIKSNKFFSAHDVKVGLQEVMKKILVDLGIEALENFTLEKYHHYVDELMHQKVIARTRQLGAEDLSFSVPNFLEKMSEYFGIPLAWTNTEDYDPRIIARINMPGSIHFNPPHKDIYQVYDSTGNIPTIVNIWIPICGVNESTSTGLPVVPSSHLLSERLVERTKAGAKVNGVKYSVNCIKSWAGSAELKTIIPAPDEMLVFSSFLIHGAAVNRNSDTTRISLEFRLFDEKPYGNLR